MTDRQTILVVEDEQPLSNVLTKKLKSFDYNVVSAADGEEALELTKSKKPDLILLDVIMPKMNGFDFLENIRLKQGNNVPVIIISNLEQREDIDTANNLGISNYVVKSNISMRKLISDIRTTLSNA